MGIKDKVLDILFDDENDAPNNIDHHEKEYKNNDKTESNPIHDTASIFIDATSPLPVTSPNPKDEKDEVEDVETNKVGDTGYQMSENISPIFGPINPKGKRSKSVSKLKNINEINNKNIDNATKTQPYSKVVISPIYGPINTRLQKKPKVRKKDVDPFYRDINDTGSFDTVLNETEEDTLDQQFEQANQEAEAVEVPETTMDDTDRINRISDRINRIKNEAVNLYHSDEPDTDVVEEDGYKVETIEYGSISEVIHDVQNHDEKMDHPTVRRLTDEEIMPEPKQEEPAKEEIDPFEEVKQNEAIEDRIKFAHVDEPSEPNEEVIEEPIEEPVEEPVVEPVEEPKAEPVQEAPKPEEKKPEPAKPESKITFDVPVFNPNNTVDNTPNAVLSEDDIFKDQDTDEGKDLFSVLFGDD